MLNPYTLNPEALHPTTRRRYSEYTAALAGQVAWNGDWSRTSPQWTFELKCALKPAPGPVPAHARGGQAAVAECLAQPRP